MDESFTDPAAAPAAAPDNPAEASSAPPEQGQGAPVEQADFFSDKFDPSSLDPSLAPAYKGMQGAFTKKTQALAEERQSLQTQLAEAQQAQQMIQRLQEDPAGLLAELGLLETDDEDVVTDDVEYVDNPELAELRAWRDQFEAERQAQQQQHTDVASLGADVDRINALRGPGNELDSDELQLIGQFADRDENGALRLLPAYEQMEKVFDKRLQAYIAGKRAPSPPGNGGQGSQTFDFHDADERQRRFAARIAAHDSE